MAVENTIVKNIYMGNGVTIEFPITFQIGDEHPEYVIVYITDATGVIKETDNFTVNLEKKVVTYPKSGDPLPVGHKITVYRKLPLYQLLNLVNQGPFFAENIEAALDNITFMMQQLSENLNRTLSASVDIVNFNANFPVKAEMGIRINDAGDGLELTEDPAKVLPLAKEILKHTELVKENTITETTQIKNETIEAKNTAVAAAETAAADTVNKVSEFLDGKVKAAALSANTAAEAANTAVSSAKNAATNASSAVESATTATEQADRAQHIADNLKGLEGLNGKATQEDAEAGTSDDKVMTPLRVKQAMGTMTFIDLLPVGWVSYKEFLLPQHVKANGATVNRSDYPTLAAYATEHNLWTDDPASEPYKYGRGDGSTTMVLPDYRNRVIQGGDTIGTLAAGLPNVMGSVTVRSAFTSATKNGALRTTSINSDWTGGKNWQENTNALYLNAADSNPIYGSSDTVQPPALQLISQIKY